MRKALKLKEVPDHSTLNQAYERFWMNLLKQLQRIQLKQLQCAQLDELGPQEEGVVF